LSYKDGSGVLCGSALTLHDKDPRPAEIIIEGVLSQQLKMIEKRWQDYVCCSYSETYKFVSRIGLVKIQKI
jgi:hypothetical protein